MGKIRTIAKTLDLATGTGVGGYPLKADFGVEYKSCLGYYAVVLTNGGISPQGCKLSFSNSSGTVVDKVALGHYLVGDAMPIKDRFFKEEPFDIDGYVNVQLDTPAPTTSPLAVQFLFVVSTEALPK
jgi:hypothetical protein